VGVSPFEVESGDFNADGKMDLVSANFDGGTISILTNNGSGNFVLFTNLDLSLYGLNRNPTGVGLGDFNGDSHMDLTVELAYNIEFIVLTNDGSGNLVLQYDWFDGGTIIFYPPSLTTTADVNGDTQPDLIEGSWNNTLSVGIRIPTLSINVTNANPVVSWPSGWTGWKLLQSSNLTTWTTNSNVFDNGTSVSCTLTSPPSHLFFRLAY
jgi:hypothetical protein